MPHRLRDNLDELDVYVTKIAARTGIPAAHLEKDLWVTEVLRGATAASASTGCSVIFKGGTSLSKAHRLIQRFSEDVDLIVVLPDAGRMTKDKTLKEFVNAAAGAASVAASAYRSVTQALIWPNAPVSTFEQCCQRIHSHASIL